MELDSALSLRRVVGGYGVFLFVSNEVAFPVVFFLVRCRSVWIAFSGLYGLSRFLACYVDVEEALTSFRGRPRSPQGNLLAAYIMAR